MGGRRPSERPRRAWNEMFCHGCGKPINGEKHVTRPSRYNFKFYHLQCWEATFL